MVDGHRLPAAHFNDPWVEQTANPPVKLMSGEDRSYLVNLVFQRVSFGFCCSVVCLPYPVHAYLDPTTMAKQSESRLGLTKSKADTLWPRTARSF